MDDLPSDGEPTPPRPSLFRRAAKPAPPSPPASAPPPKRKKRGRASLMSQLSAFLTLALVGAAVAIGGFAFVSMEVRRPGPLAADKVVVLTREDDGGPLADQLEKAGVIPNSMLFSLMTLVDGQRNAMKRGEYKFPAGISMREVEDMLAHHRVLKHKLTIPEGLTSQQIVERLKADDLLVGEIKETPREGALFPDTYVYERGDSRNAIIAHMQSAMTKIVASVWAGRVQGLPIKSPGELVTLASIVEKETGRADERPRVAAVFVNRLQKHMKLQSDPTIVYGLVFGKGTLGHSITKAELQEATPYNTYFIDGLPPGPICNPGRAAMEAVANPAHTRDLFFVADGTGGHAFAETLADHQRNVAHWRQIEKDAKDRLAPDATPPSNIRGQAPDMQGSRYGALAPEDAFGGLSYAALPAAAKSGKLEKLVEARRKMESLTGSGGSLSAKKLGAGALDSLVVLGVNDPPPGSDEPLAPAEDGPVASVPLSPAAAADLRAREARYGSAAVASASANAPIVTQGVVGRGFDATEGTRLDPLRNKTYDLSFPKTVPKTLN